MWSYLIRTVLQRCVLLFFISLISHAVIHLAPGAPSEVDPMNPRMKAGDIVKIRKAFHLDEPLHKQYAHWARDLATGELRSFKDGEPVLPRICGPLLELAAAVCVRHLAHLDFVVSAGNSRRRQARRTVRPGQHGACLCADLRCRPSSFRTC
ncbi:MAG: hypothetical protein QM756_42075 [Polyangiaceae bacterium]